jgi:telomere length regulation protein
MDTEAGERLANLILTMKTFEQRKIFDAVISFVVKRFASMDNVQRGDAPIAASKTVSGLAIFFDTILRKNEALRDYVVILLTRCATPALNDSLAIRRSMMAALAQDEGRSRRVSILSCRLIADRQASHAATR